MNKRQTLALALTLLALPVAVGAQPPADASVARTATGQLTIRWTSADPVDVLVTDGPGQPIKAGTLVSGANRVGSETLQDQDMARRYFTLRNTRTGETTRIAERAVPLEHGSNFRDIGGYPAAGGRHVRWGMIFRSGATALIDAHDASQIGNLHLAEMVDLRSDEERVLAPSRIDGVPYAAIGYSMGAMGFSGGMETGYRNFPKFLAPQLRMVFAKLLSGQQPLVYNCSAGQDRTGFVSAMILSALGTPRPAIIADYHLSTLYRRPGDEMPRIDPAMAAANPVAAMFAKYQSDPRYDVPQPLKTAEGKAYLDFAFAEIERNWGSVDRYLQMEIGLKPRDLQRLRALYTE